MASNHSSFHRDGDCNGDGQLNIADAIAVLSLLFLGSGDPPCADACDVNDDAVIDIADPVFLLDWLFGNGGTLPEPYPFCGSDPTADPLDCIEGTDCL